MVQGSATVADNASIVTSQTAPVPATLPRAPPASTHRRSHSLSQRPTMLKAFGGMLSGHGPRERVGAGAGVGGDGVQVPATAAPELGTFEERAEREVVESQQRQQQQQQQQMKEVKEERGSGALHGSPGGSIARRFGTLLGGVRAGSSEDGRRHGMKRASILGRLSPRPSGDGSSGDQEKGKERERSVDVVDEAGVMHSRVVENGDDKENVDVRNGTVKASSDGKMTHSQSLPGGQTQPVTTVHRRAATILDPQGRTARHERRSSASAALFSSGTTGRGNRRPSTSGTMTGARSNGFGGLDVAEEDEGEIDEIEHGGRVGLTDDEQEQDQFHERGGDKEFKPVFLKGLFRCDSFLLCLFLVLWNGELTLGFFVLRRFCD